MMWDRRLIGRRAGDHPQTALGAKTARPNRRAPVVEPLESRMLLTQFYSGATAVRPVQTTSGVYTLTVSGPGLVNVKPLGRGVIGLTIYGSTGATTVDASLTRQKLHQPAGSLSIGSIRILSGQIGGITAGAADLLGPMTPLNGSVNVMHFGSLGPNAKVDIGGSVGNLTVGGIDLGPNGHVNIGGNLAQGLNVGALNLDGGTFSVGNDLSGTLNAGSIRLARNAQFSVGHDLSGGATVVGNLAVGNSSTFSVGHNLSGLTVGQGLTLDTGGQFTVGNDLAGAVNIGGTTTLASNARFVVSRDVPNALTFNGDLNIASNARVAVGRDLNSLDVNGDLIIGSGGSLGVGGNFNNLLVNGMIRGQGSKSAIDLAVGLDLGRLTVLGGAADQGGIQSANINVGKSLLGLDVRHGIFNSLITAGVLIDGGGAAGAGGNIGPDGPDALRNSELRAGVNINHLTINGNVISTFATDPNAPGYPTRIIAGESRAGVFGSGGLIDNFQILGHMTDSVIAASVKPSGGNGTLPAFAYGTPSAVPSTDPGDLGFNTYDAPAGTITGGTVGNPIKYPNFSELSYYNETLTGVTYAPVLDQTIDDFIYPGAINPSFASAPLSGTSLIDPTQVLPLPTQSTVHGGVFSTAHGDNADYAGIFAADTRGVFVGTLPS